MGVKDTIEMFVVLLSHGGSSEYLEEFLYSCGFNKKRNKVTQTVQKYSFKKVFT